MRGEKMKRWNTTQHAEVESAKVDAFLADVLEVCKKHGLSISHEDGHGAFEIVAYNDYYVEWLSNAHDATGK
jgi:hypothetical protein